MLVIMLFNHLKNKLLLIVEIIFLINKCDFLKIIMSNQKNFLKIFYSYLEYLQRLGIALFSLKQLLLLELGRDPTCQKNRILC